jgi:hypothetical protein
MFVLNTSEIADVDGAGYIKPLDLIINYPDLPTTIGNSYDNVLRDKNGNSRVSKLQVPQKIVPLM